MAVADTIYTYEEMKERYSMREKENMRREIKDQIKRYGKI